MEIKIGQKVYEHNSSRIYESTVSDIYIYNNRTIYQTDGVDFDERAIGSSIFLSRQAARKHLEALDKSKKL